MRELLPYDLLRVWEQGYGEPSYRRALLLLTAACPEQSHDELARLSIGCRDARLITLRGWTFGPRLACVTACPACGDRLEINMNVSDIRLDVPESHVNDFSLERDGYQVVFRLPGTADLDRANGSGSKENMRRAIIRQCILRVRRNGAEVAADQLPAAVMDAVAAGMAERDPQADTRFNLTCPKCSHRWHALFDIVSFFWSEIQAWSLRILREVHILASAYGWREEDILAMSPLRRQSYVNMVSP